MTREQEYDAAYARVSACEACATVVGVEVSGVGIPASIKDEAAYRDEVKRILSDLNGRAADYDSDADSLRLA